jgi:hypothetical protein
MSIENLSAAKPEIPPAATAIVQLVSTAGYHPESRFGLLEKSKDAILITKGFEGVAVTWIEPDALIRSQPGLAPATPAYLFISTVESSRTITRTESKVSVN